MSTKGPSNRYDNTRGGKKCKFSKNIAFPWAKDFVKTKKSKHFKEHGKETSSDTLESYIAHAVKFANTIDKKNCVSFIDNNDTTYKYNVKTNEMVLVTKDGFVITYFKPKDGYVYYLDQKKKSGGK